MTNSNFSWIKLNLFITLKLIYFITGKQMKNINFYITFYLYDNECIVDNLAGNNIKFSKSKMGITG